MARIIESWHSTDDKRRLKIVRTDYFTDVEGEIVAADEAAGVCSVVLNGETKTLCFGPDGIRIVQREKWRTFATF